MPSRVDGPGNLSMASGRHSECIVHLVGVGSPPESSCGRYRQASLERFSVR